MDKAPINSQAVNPDSEAVLRIFESAVEKHLAGELDKAEELYRQALSLYPDLSDAHNNLGNIHQQRGDWESATVCYRKAAQLGNAQAESNLGCASMHGGRLEEAILHLQRATSLDPTSATAFNNLGAAYLRSKRLSEAAASCVNALAINPNYASAHNNLGLALHELGRLAEAVEHFRSALSINPDDAEVYTNLAGPLITQGDLDEAWACYRTALSIKPDLAEAHFGLLLGLHYCDSVTPEEILTESRRFAASIKAIGPFDFHQNDRTPTRRLRIGYVSPDFRRHSVAFFIEPILKAHHRDEFEIVAYSNVARPDEVTGRIRASCALWRDIYRFNDEQLVEQVRYDQVDILVDLAGHTTGNRLLAFARRPAPVQVTYLGYPGTTGLDAIDYRFTDRWADPAGLSDNYYSEKLIRLNHGFLCYQTPADAPPVGSRPAQDSRQISFISCNNLPKINSAVIKVWAEILRAVPNSRLILKAEGLGQPEARERVISLFLKSGIGSERLLLHGHIPVFRDHLSIYGQADMALDTFPYNGTTTTCEALWMGVPVITLAGRSHAGRVGVSLLTRLGLEDLIAEGPQQYIEQAVRLANDGARLQEISGQLRERLSKSSVTDARLVTQSIEEAYRAMWRDYCARH
jgi:protein O-GlcNAc transferase